MSDKIENVYLQIHDLAFMSSSSCARLYSSQTQSWSLIITKSIAKGTWNPLLGLDYRMGLLGLGPGALDQILWISGWNTNKIKKLLYKNSKIVGKKCFPHHNDAIPTNTDLYVHIMYFNSSKIFKIFWWFRIGSWMHIRPWAHSFLNRALSITHKNIK